MKKCISRKNAVFFFLVGLVIMGALISVAWSRGYTKRVHCLIAGHQWERTISDEWCWVINREVSDDRYPYGYKYRQKPNSVRCVRDGVYLFNTPFVEEDVYALKSVPEGLDEPRCEDVVKTFHITGGTVFELGYPDSELSGRYAGYPGRMEGRSEEYDGKGRLRSRWQCRRDRMHGLAEFFYPNGSLQWQGTYVRGRLHGEVKEYFEDNTLKRSDEYVDGINHGVSKLYYPTGQLRWVRTFKKGVRDGETKEYYSDGSLFREGTFHNGKGTFREYSADQSMVREATFDHGVVTYISDYQKITN